MSLRAEVVADTRAILEGDGVVITLTAPGVGGAVYALTGFYNRVGAEINADGSTVATDKSTISISLAAIVAAGLADVEDLKKPGWRVVVADALGTSFTGRIDTPFLDRSLGVGTFLLKKGAP